MVLKKKYKVKASVLYKKSAEQGYENAQKQLKKLLEIKNRRKNNSCKVN